MTLPLMEYIPTQAPTGGADKYHGAVATGYDAKRENDPKWTLEQAHIEDMLSDLPAGSTVLDVPVGTGRFIQFYEAHGLKAVGMDKSEDMLKQAAVKVVDRDKVQFMLGDVRGLSDFADRFDVAVMCRLTRWLSPSDCVLALQNLQKIATKKIIFTARVRNHPEARTYELIKSALDGWAIARDEPGADLDYRIIELRPVGVIIKDLGLSKRTLAALRNNQIDSIEKLLGADERWLMRCPNIGRKTIHEIQGALCSAGLQPLPEKWGQA